MSAPGTVAIIGVRTFLGARVAERLLAARARVRVVGVDVRRPYRLADRIDFERVDMTDPRASEQLAALFTREGVDVVLHTAFRRDPTPDVETDHELETVGTLHVLNACAAAGVERLVVESSTMLYGPWPDNPNFLSEDHPLRGHPDAHCVRNRVEMEALVAGWAARHPGTRTSVLRHGWLMGPTYWDSVVRHFASPVVPTVLGYDPLLQLVHEDDCVHAFESAVLRPRPGVFNVVAPEVLPLSMMLRIAGRRALPVPAPLLYRVRDLPSRARSGDPPAGFYDYLRYLWVADGKRGWDAFGEPAYTTREAWMAFVSSRRMRRYR